MLARSRRPFLVLGPALFALLFAVQPAAAATVLSHTGQYGNFVINDNHDTTRGADCNYETHKEVHYLLNAFWLDSVKVRGPKIFAYNDGSGTKQPVGWMFKVQSSPAGNPNGWKTFYTSLSAKQLTTVHGGFQFSPVGWNAPENPPADTNWRVVMTLQWFKRGHPTLLTGRVVATIDFYNVKGGGATVPPTVRQTDCYVNN